MLFCWDYDEHGNVEHIAEHGLTTDDVEYAFDHATAHVTSRSSGRPALYGLPMTGLHSRNAPSIGFIPPNNARLAPVI